MLSEHIKCLGRERAGLPLVAKPRLPAREL
jgi:hypothetical protein